MFPNLMIYAAGWAEEELPELPRDLAHRPDESFHWICTGEHFVPLPDPVYDFWLHARHRLVPLNSLVTVLSQAFPLEEVREGLRTLWETQALITWPWWQSPGPPSTSQPEFLYLAGTEHTPNPWPRIVSDTVWHRTPSLQQLLGDPLGQTFHSPAIWRRLEAELPAVLAQQPALHWFVWSRAPWLGEVSALLASEGSAR